MAYHRRKESWEWKTTKTRKNCKCLACKEEIKKGTPRYRQGPYHSLCIACYDQWQTTPEGTILMNIKRYKKDD